MFSSHQLILNFQMKTVISQSLLLKKLTTLNTIFLNTFLKNNTLFQLIILAVNKYALFDEQKNCFSEFSVLV